MTLAGRRREMMQIEQLLERAASGTGDLLVIVGAHGSGKTAVLDAAVEEARLRGWAVARTTFSAGAPYRLPWVQLLRDIGAPDVVAARLLDDGGALTLDDAARALTTGRRLIVVDDVDAGGPDARAVLAAVAGRAKSGATAVLAAATLAPGVGRVLHLDALSEEELANAVGVPPEARHALWVVSGGLPGIARSLVSQLSHADFSADPVVNLALDSGSRAGFLEVDTQVVRLLEVALEQKSDDSTRARLLARLARELLGDAPSGRHRRKLVDEALVLARRSGDPAVLGEVLEARLHALWDPDGADDRLAAAGEILDLIRASGDDELERQALFWRFVALMELGRVDEAESALAAFARSGVAGDDGQSRFMVTSRQAMLAILRGRLEEAFRLADEARRLGIQAGVPDTERLVNSLRAAVAAVRQDPEADLPVAAAAVEQLLSASRLLPGHLFEANLALVLLVGGREGEASLELQRILPRALASSGPRWLGAIADLSVVAARTHNADASARLYDALAPYAGRLVVMGGAATVSGPADHYLGLLASELGDFDGAVRHFNDAITLTEQIGALPHLAFALEGLADALTPRGAAGDLERASQARRQARSIAEQVGMTGLVERLARPADEWILVRDGDDWILEAGAERLRLRDGQGVRYLRNLVAAPGRDIAALDLAAGGAGLVASSPGPVIDAAALAAYKQRLDDLDAVLEDDAGDPLRLEHAEAERDALLAELRRVHALGRRLRDTTPEAERARVNVTRTLRATIERIGVAAPRAAAHLRASIRTGRDCRYEPAPGGPYRWHV